MCMQGISMSSVVVESDCYTCSSSSDDCRRFDNCDVSIVWSISIDARLFLLIEDLFCSFVIKMNVHSNVQPTQTWTGIEKYEDVDDAGSRLPVALDAPGDYYHPRGPGTSLQKESHINYFVQGSVDSGRDGDTATDGAAVGTTVRNFTVPC